MNFSWKGLFQHDGYRPSEIEDSMLLRFLVLLTISTAILATSWAAESKLFLPISAIIASSIGFWLSWQRRRSKNLWIKIILALLMLVALASFLYEISDNPFDARLPLAHLLIWLQVLHSFDLPRRKDIFYSLWVALILISVAATISRDISFGGFLIVYAILTLFSLLTSHLSSQGIVKPQTKFWLKLSLPVTTLLVIGTALLFVFMPRYDGMKIQSFPVSMQIKNLPLFKGEIKNKSYPNRASNQNGKNSDTNKKKGVFDPYAYYGFSTQLDLNYRGHLADHIVMRVRSSHPSYWRGMAFDLYDGLSWKMSRPYDLKRLGRGQLPIWIRESNELKKNIVPRKRVIQTFYIEKDQSNLIFKAPYAEFLYFPTDYVLMDSYGSIRAPIELFQDTTYSVISEIPIFSEQKLREITWAQIKNQRVAENYYQTPKNLPMRVQTKAKEITAQTQTPYDAVKAIEFYLERSFPYDLEIPEFPENTDSIDYFMFEQQAGYCEHFASSLAIMARNLGLASRFVTGYTTGSYNPMTGYFDVKGSDAHGWVEVYFPHHGWVPFDPTPGFSASLHKEPVNKGVSTGQFWNYFKAWIPEGFKQAVSDIVAKILSFILVIFTFSAGLLTLLPLKTLIISVSALIILVLISVFWLFKRQPASIRHRFQPAFSSDPERLQFVKAYQQWLAKITDHFDLEFHAHWTPTEQIRLLKDHLEPKAFNKTTQITDLYYEIRYSKVPLQKKQMEQAKKDMHIIAQTLTKNDQKVHQSW